VGRRTPSRGLSYLLPRHLIPGRGERGPRSSASSVAWRSFCCPMASARGLGSGCGTSTTPRSPSLGGSALARDQLALVIQQQRPVLDQLIQIRSARRRAPRCGDLRMTLLARMVLVSQAPQPDGAIRGTRRQQALVRAELKFGDLASVTLEGVNAHAGVGRVDLDAASTVLPAPK
jgi:hypothetical protein